MKSYIYMSLLIKQFWKEQIALIDTELRVAPDAFIRAWMSDTKHLDADIIVCMNVREWAI